ncbi:MAG: DUF4197 domain-containing protein [Betaproteobacteria bacterium]|nr:DUF4197 domain-containing protein [Betaproteobacteria bacterium]
MIRRIVALVLAAWTCTALAQLGQITNRDAVAGLKAALEKGTGAAVGVLGRTDGYFGNPAVRIPLPESIRRYEGLMRSFGLGKYVDELELTMNRAAEAAVPQAKTIFVNAVKNMSVQDAKGILTGGPTSATDYFRRKTSDSLRAKFLPIVKRETAKLKLAQKYDEFAGKGARFGLVSKEDASLDGYVTRKALDGLFYMVGQEERKIRQDPVGAGSAIIEKAFGALKR